MGSFPSIWSVDTSSEDYEFLIGILTLFRWIETLPSEIHFPKMPEEGPKALSLYLSSK